MNRLEFISGLILVLLGGAHIVMALASGGDAASVRMPWLSATGLVLGFAGALNILCATTVRPRILLTGCCALANLSALVYLGVFIEYWEGRLMPLALMAIAGALLWVTGNTMRRLRAPRAEVPRSAPLPPDAPGTALPAANPLDPDLHLQLAQDAARTGRPYLALAELRTAAFLGAEPVRVAPLESTFRAALPESRIMNHNQYFRFASLAAEFKARAGDTAASVLDVGGGHGELAAFLPSGAGYCLAEPGVNGISGTALPFAERSFDFVISCHVLEHVAPVEREKFLDQLLACARRGVILLNPFDVAGTLPEERLKLIIEITDSAWAKEHLECTLPRVDDVRAYAARRGLQFDARPSGTLATSLALVFVDYFAARSGLTRQWRSLNAFYNERISGILDSPDYPAAYMVYLGRAQHDDPKQAARHERPAG